MNQTSDSIAMYCPHTPFPKQQEFIDLTCKEAFYGGAAGPGKTDALLMAALQYVHVPQYSALILRRDFPRLSLPSSIMDRAKQWLHPHGDVKWNSQDKLFRFPSGATLQFGYIDNPDDRFRYASSEYQFLGFDELTEFRLASDEANPYLFMFSRLRKTKDNPVPLRVRSASNPGNTGHQFVKQRFITEEAIEAMKAGGSGVFFADSARSIAFVPGLLKDNPALDANEYKKGLMHLPPVTRERLLNGDWSVQEASVINPQWLRYYQTKGEILHCLDEENAASRIVIDSRQCKRFAVIDTAGTSKEKAAEKRGKPPSYSVCGIWDYWPQAKLLFLRHVWRDRVGWDGLKAGITRTLQAWRPQKTHIENAHHGPPLASELRNDFAIQMLNPVLPKMQKGQSAKLERAVAGGLLTMLENAQIYLPDIANVEGAAAWLPQFEAELLGFTGVEGEQTADQVDIASYAAYVADTKAAPKWGGVIK